MVEYERRIASGRDLVDAIVFRCCSDLSAKVVSWIASINAV
jgi:hypothetical protein